VLGIDSSARTLESLERTNLLVVRADASGRWYRYHALFREILRDELDRREPERVAELVGLAARWCEENGEPEEAIAYAREAGDVDRVARLAAAHSQRFFLQGRETTVRGWFDWLRTNAPIDVYAPAGVLGVVADALAGRPDEAERWADLVDDAGVRGGAPDGSTSIEAWLALMRAILARGGIEQARIDAGLAYGTLAHDSPLRPLARLLVGLAHLAAGDGDDAAVAFEDAVAQAERVGAVGTVIVGLSELSALALERGDDRAASDLAIRAAGRRDESGLSEYPIAALSYAVMARGALHRADLPRARRELARAHRLRPGLTRAFPLFAVQTLLEMTSVHATLADAPGALTLLRDVEGLTHERPDLGALLDRATTLRERVDAIRVRAPGAMSLTTAELELLPALSSHLTFREIAERRGVSPHTVKTQASSIYRKLRVTSRGDAIARAEALGLLDDLGPTGQLPSI
jgi:LuxR family maltose regulon positive regulatory protein